MLAVVHSADDALRGRATALLMHFGSGYEEEKEFLKDVYALFDTRGYLPLLGSRPKITLS